jgi:phosphoribosyl-ATP pyrophosphohydrolase/phosphoribosyl-AMP cyclohydrolase
VTVNTKGPACHTGANTCFFNYVLKKEKSSDTADTTSPFTPDTLQSIINDRKTNPKPGSYTTYLFEKGKDKMLKKIGEEATEVIIAGKANDKAETIYEIADLIYHSMVLMAEMSITNDDIIKELDSRFNK